jgi:hypothetical protein
MSNNSLGAICILAIASMIMTASIIETCKPGAMLPKKEQAQ